MSADYILRLLEQIAAILAGIIARRARGESLAALDEIEGKCLENVGLPFVVIKQSAPEAIVELLATGGALRIPRSIILAELLLQEASIREVQGNPVSAALSYACAEHLIVDVLPLLGREEQHAYETKLADIAAKRRDLG